MLRAPSNVTDFLVTESAAMRAVADQVDAFATSEQPVLITGEHGTGRELIARVLHQRGPRRRGRFIAVRPTFESSDIAPPAGRETRDRCERAHRALCAAAGGTLLVKDIIDLSAPSQHTLRRAMRDRSVKPETHDVRIVATSDGDIDLAVDANIVAREFYDLFQHHRIDVPPLRLRLEDLPALLERWIKYYAAEIGRNRPTISTRAHERMAAYPWPGNVGELKSVARRLVVRVKRSRIEAGDVDEILPVVAARVPLEDLAFEDMVKAKLGGFLARIDGYPVRDLYDNVIARVERPLFDLVLARTGGNQLKAAELLGLNRNTLRKKLADLGTVSTRHTSRSSRALDQA